ncbi:MAG: PAAR domain-containing protein [Pirellulales bacterium]
MPPAARITDMHTCPMVTPGTPPIPHVGGPISKGAATVMIGFMPAARMGDMAVCVGPPDTIAKGSPTVLIENMMAARVGDLTAHGGVISVGFPMVMIGEMGMGSAATTQGKAMRQAKEGAVPFCQKCGT